MGLGLQHGGALTVKHLLGRICWEAVSHGCSQRKKRNDCARETGRQSFVSSVQANVRCGDGGVVLLSLPRSLLVLLLLPLPDAEEGNWGMFGLTEGVNKVGLSDHRGLLLLC